MVGVDGGGVVLWRLVAVGRGRHGVHAALHGERLHGDGVAGRLRGGHDGGGGGSRGGSRPRRRRFRRQRVTRRRLRLKFNYLCFVLFLE